MEKMTLQHSGRQGGLSHFCELCQEPRVCTMLYRVHDYEIVRCDDCRLVFVAPGGFTAAQVAGWYSKEYFEGGISAGYTDYGASERILRHQAQATLRHLRRYQPSGTLLEIGCAYGFFLLEARRFFRVTGMEISRFAGEQARSRELDIIIGDFQELAVPPAHYSAVCLFDCIEHLAKPSNYLRKIHSALSPGGIVALSTGDISSLFARISGRRWRLMAPPLHLFYFSRATISNILEKAGFEVLEVSYPGKAVPWSLILYMLSPRLKAALGPVGRLPLRIYINLFDAMLVIARKR
jgi:SAM-dependent methyltransferase